MRKCRFTRKPDRRHFEEWRRRCPACQLTTGLSRRRPRVRVCQDEALAECADAPELNRRRSVSLRILPPTPAEK
jgi:hypothetical protein